MCEFFSKKLELVRARPKISPGGLPVSSINSVHININIYIYIYTLLLRINSINITSSAFEVGELHKSELRGCHKSEFS